MRENQLKRKLKRGEVVLGPFINCAYPAFIEICGHAGFDFAVIDMEHGALNTLVAEDLCRAADCVGLAPIVRIRKNDAPQIQRALDIGSAGVQVPQIETQSDAADVVRGAKYSPLGSRGLSFYTRAGVYAAAGTQITNQLNEESLIVVHVEGIRGVENIEEIVSVPHIDVIFLGPYDLSQSLGIPGQVQDSRVIELMQKCVTTICKAGKSAGTFADNPETAKQWIDAGVQYITLGVDVGIFLRACEALVKAVRT
ncbi:aldolase [Coleofasciculus sp. FACHB-64]|uniref:HpcH/HpaI aldolase family protein n=1 Tax=Cyanophyceae TaxID=3028117 RepID=UPI001689B68A|nr:MULTISPECIES: aldolase/citrate lyase family protein [unclassified Coleofasciculus]MBD1837692.1 aldolase [Coleofasciculus sp. FACHB-501]MBD2046966.1 aldolase [Coleofasciculus sp. FACHB-64]